MKFEQLAIFCATILLVCGSPSYGQDAPSTKITELYARLGDAIQSGNSELIQILTQEIAAAAPLPTTPKADSAITDGVTTDNLSNSTTLFDNLRADGFRLQRGPGNVGDDAKPASFSFSKDIEGGSDFAFGSNFFLGWSPNRVATAQNEDGDLLLRGDIEPFRNTSLMTEASVQGRLATQTPNSSDAWRFRLGGNLYHRNPKKSGRADEIERLVLEGKAANTLEAKKMLGPNPFTMETTCFSRENMRLIWISKVEELA